MLSRTTLDRLQAFKIPGFVDALVAQLQGGAQYHDLSFEERLTLLIDTEHTRRLDVRTKRMLKEARLPNSASLDELDFAVQRGLRKQPVLELIEGNWLAAGTNLIITGPTGVGKTFLGSVVAHSLILRGLSVRFHRTHQWLTDLVTYAERRRLSQTIANFQRIPLLIFDEWLLDPLTGSQARLLLDLFDARFHKHSCMFITQLPVAAWHERFADPTLADAVLDRLVHNSVRIELSGPSMREIRAPVKSQRADTSLRSGNLD